MIRRGGAHFGGDQWILHFLIALPDVDPTRAPPVYLHAPAVEDERHVAAAARAIAADGDRRHDAIDKLDCADRVDVHPRSVPIDESEYLIDI